MCKRDTEEKANGLRRDYWIEHNHLEKSLSCLNWKILSNHKAIFTHERTNQISVPLASPGHSTSLKGKTGFHHRTFWTKWQWRMISSSPRQMAIHHRWHLDPFNFPSSEQWREGKEKTQNFAHLGGKDGNQSITILMPLVSTWYS